MCTAVLMMSNFFFQVDTSIATAAETTAPRRVAQAFMVDLDDISSCQTSDNGLGGKGGGGGSLSQYVPLRLRNAISAREEIQQQKRRAKESVITPAPTPKTVSPLPRH